MGFVKRIFLFLAINFLVIMTLSALLKIFNVQPYLTQYGLDARQLLIFCLIWGMGGAFISLSLSRIMAKWMMGVKVIDLNTTEDPQLRRLLSTIEVLSRKAGLPDVPQVGIYESPEVNAFATGPTKRRSLVAVSRGLLNQMNQNELEGVLAHEISHISNGDMVTMTLIQGVVNAFVMFLARALAFVLSGLGRGNQRRESGMGSYATYMILVFVFEVIFMVLGSMVVFWFSRRREFKADRGGAELAGKHNMIAALQSLSNLTTRHDIKAEQPAFQTMKISTRSRSHGLALLFASHPPLETRIERLQELR